MPEELFLELAVLARLGSTNNSGVAKSLILRQVKATQKQIGMDEWRRLLAEVKKEGGQ